ncbi:MAG: hypothetical protein MJ066_02655 [Clostridia bacterium]|nr:hypothetical protein [Clostridia bacterium]
MKNKVRDIDLSKKKYTQSEVVDIVDTLSNDYQKIISELKDKVKTLTESNKTLDKKLNEYSDKDSIIGAALKDSEEKALETLSKAEKRYNLAAEKLRMFSIKWDGYFKFLKEKYPYYPIITKSIELKEKIKSLLKGSNKEEEFKKIDKNLNEATKISMGFNPKEKIKEYVASTSDNGFNLDEVLNPGELELEDLCKELGLIDEKS